VTARSWLTRSSQLLHPWGTGLVYPNFPDEELRDPWSSYWGSNRQRLTQVKAVYDPDNLFRPPPSVELY
jgi:FAD/FMN-containing dehydrogenase